MSFLDALISQYKHMGCHLDLIYFFLYIFKYVLGSNQKQSYEEISLDAWVKIPGSYVSYHSEKLFCQPLPSGCHNVITAATSYVKHHINMFLEYQLDTFGDINITEKTEEHIWSGAKWFHP